MADEQVLARLLERHGRTYADEVGIRVRGRPNDLFQLLVMALLMSARISSDIAVRAARALFDHGFTDARAMAEASWQERVDALGEGSYIRYDESTSRYLAASSELLLDRYDGDLRRLRDDADHDSTRMRSLLQHCKGIGDVGVDIFFREVQLVWEELYPFAGGALHTAEALRLGGSARELSGLVPRERFPELVAALIRARLADDVRTVRDGPGDLPPTSTQLDTMSKDEIYEVAQEREVSGRSQMTKDELRQALRD